MRNVKQKIQQDLVIVKNHVFTVKDCEKIVNLKPTLKQQIKKKYDEITKITYIDVIRDYIILSANILK